MAQPPNQPYSYPGGGQPLVSYPNQPPAGDGAGYPNQPGPGAPGYPPSQPAPGATPYPPGPAGQPAPSQPANMPSAPSAPEMYVPNTTDGLSKFEGYGDIGFGDGSSLRPPSPPPYEPPTEVAPVQFGAGGHISDQEAREALLTHVAQHCCWGAGAAKEMKIHAIDPSNALHYKLETFCEGRQTVRVEVPHNGQVVDGPFNGSPPLPWQIPCSPGSYFADAEYRITVPHTDEIRTCGKCLGAGQVRCYRCHATGRMQCSFCHGRGHRQVFRDGHHHHEHCHHCHQSGYTTCNVCHGRCSLMCNHCKGSGQVKSFIQLIINFKNYITDYIMEETDMPDHLIRNVSGSEIFTQTANQVYPLVSFPVRNINEQSVSLIEQARTAHLNERQLTQRHSIRAVPVTQVGYRFKERDRKYWVYGQERQVFTPDYPQQCCCGCTIL